MAYTADINIVVRGQAAVNKLQKDLVELGQKLDDITKRRIGPSTALETFNAQLREATQQLNKVAAGTTDETTAIKNYVTALGNANAATERQNKLIEKEIDLRQSATKGAQELADVQQYLFEKQRRLENSKLNEQATKVQAALDRQAAAAAESAAQIDKLNRSQADFTARTDEAARAASRQTAEFIRQQRIAKEVAKINANAPAAQLLLAPASPGAPAMGGGARRAITGPVERLGGARTQDEAATALRFAQALKEQVRPLSQIESLYAGISRAAAQTQRFKALPDTAMLNAAGRGIQQLENAQDRYNRELAEGAQRLRQLDLLEASRARRADKLRQRADYYNAPGTMANAGFGVQGPAVPPGGIPRPARGGAAAGAGGLLNMAPGFENLALGAGFPLLFGGGAGQVAGGLLGSFVGTGFGGQILGSAIGQQLEDAFRRVGEISAALNRLDMEALRTSAIAVNSELDTTVRRLIEAGKYDEARLAIGKQITQQTGLLPEYLSRSARATNALNTAWSEFTGAISGLLAVAGTEVVTLLATIIQGIAKVTQGATFLIQIIKEYVPGLNLIVTVIKLLGKVLPQVSETAEQLTAKIREATDAGNRQLSVLLQQEEVDKRRVRGNTAWAQLQNNELDRQSKIIDIRQKGEDALLALRKEYAGVTSREGLKELKLREDQLKAETAIAVRATDREAARKREEILLQAALEKTQVILNVETSRLSIAKELADQQERIRAAQVTTATTANKLEAERLNVQKQSSLTLQTDLDVNSKIAANRVNAAAQELQDAKSRAAFSVYEAQNQAAIAQQKATAASKDMETLRTAGQLTDLKRAELQTVISGAEVATKNVDTTRRVAEESIKSAEAVERATRATIERERREQLVALAVAESTRQIEQAERIATERTGKLNNQLTLTVAIADAQRTINDIELDSLRTKLNQTTNEEQRAAILNRIQDIEISNAALTLKATRAQIQAEVLRQKIALKLAEAKYKEYEAVVRLAEAQGVQQRAHYEALDAQASALRLSHDSYNTAVKIADVQWKTADAVYQGAVNAARMRRELAATSAVQSDITFGQGLGQVFQLGRTYQGSSFQAMAAGGFVKKPTFAMIGEGGQGEYVVPESKASAFAMNYMLGARGAGAIDGNAAPPAINIQTGPVMQQGGQNYVTIQDMEAGLQAVADTILNNSRSYSARRFAGVS